MEMAMRDSSSSSSSTSRETGNSNGNGHRRRDDLIGSDDRYEQEVRSVSGRFLQTDKAALQQAPVSSAGSGNAQRRRLFSQPQQRQRSNGHHGSAVAQLQQRPAWQQPTSQQHATGQQQQVDGMSAIGESQVAWDTGFHGRGVNGVMNIQGIQLNDEVLQPDITGSTEEYTAMIGCSIGSHHYVHSCSSAAQAAVAVG